MTKKIPRLQLRKHTYYIRIAVPKIILDLVKKKEVRYSLKTNNYFQALSQLRIENAKIEMYFAFLEELKMKLEGGFITLTDTELDQVLIYRIRQIDDFFEKNYTDIQKGNVDANDFAIFSNKKVAEYNEAIKDPNVPDSDDDTQNPEDINFIKYQIQKLLMDYLEWLKNKPNTNLSVYNFIEKIQKEKGIFFQITQNDDDSKRPSQMIQFYKDLLNLENFTKERTGLTPKSTSFGSDNFKIMKLRAVAEHQRKQELEEGPVILNKWEDVFNDMIRPAKHNKSITESHLNTKKQCIETIFQLIDKQYVEKITFDDCRKINKLIYLIPKRWQEKHPNKRLLDVLLPEDADNSKDALSGSSVRKYITIFQEFLKYCRQQRLIDTDIADILNKPQIDKNKNVWQPFETDELKKIFNPKTYFKRKKDEDNHKFWIPIISLYSGMRLNEICQIRINDIKNEKNIDYIQITDDGEKQSVKNYASTRRVPIHPILKELGFMEQIKVAKKKKQDRLFYSLTYSTKNRYAGSMSNAFRYYMDKVIKIKNSKKVFHSFRHTARGTYINNGVSEEFVNIICGWEGVGAGAKNYLHREKVDIKKLDKAIRKLKYPEVEKMLLGK